MRRAGYGCQSTLRIFRSPRGHRPWTRACGGVRGRGCVFWGVRAVRKVLFIATVLIPVAFGPAYAADLPGRPDPSPIMMEPVFNWAGFYLGGVLGGRWGKVDDATGAGAANISGLTGGILAGGNFQTGNFVFGIEADGGSGTTSGSNDAAGGVIASADVQATAHVRA